MEICLKPSYTCVENLTRYTYKHEGIVKISVRIQKDLNDSKFFLTSLK